MENMSKDYFYANVCHVCKKTDRNVALTKCRKCNMISYCSTKHMLQDKQNHAELCGVILHYHILNNKKGIPTTEEVPDHQQWLHSKYQFMTAIQEILNRPLMRFEKQMFMFPRSCVICHKQEHLEYCICESANFCSAHLNNNGHRNEIVCNLMRISFILDNTDNWKDQILDMRYLQYLPDKPHIVSRKGEPAIVSFFIKYIAPYVNLKTNPENFVHLMHYHIQQITAPLTLLFAIHRIEYLKFQNTLDIYIITNEFLDIASLHGWEILLHLMTHLTDLRIVSIGPKLQVESFKACDYLCEKCISCKKKLSYASIPFYRQFIKVHKPDLIISFNARIYEGKENHIDLKTYDYTSNINNWKDILQCLTDLRVSPVILTCYNRTEAKKNASAIDNILHKKQHVTKMKNPFCGIRPYRNPETEAVLFQNEHIIVYSSFSRDE